MMDGWFFSGSKLRTKLDTIFHFYGNLENKYKINLHQLFRNKKTNFGDRFDIQIHVHYFLDDREYTTTLDYVIECRKNEMQYPPNWFMFLFPGAY